MPRTKPSDQAAASFEVYKRHLATFAADPTIPNAHRALDSHRNFLVDFDIGPTRAVVKQQILADRLNQAMDRAKRAKQVEALKSRRAGAIASTDPR